MNSDIHNLRSETLHQQYELVRIRLLTHCYGTNREFFFLSYRKDQLFIIVCLNKRDCLYLESLRGLAKKYLDVILLVANVNSLISL